MAAMGGVEVPQATKDAEHRPTTPSGPTPRAGTSGLLNLVERVGNKVPHPVVIFVALIGLVVALSHLFYMMGASADVQAINPETHAARDVHRQRPSLLTGDGIRFMYSDVIQNFMNFTAVGVIIVAMLGVGVAEAAGSRRGADPQAGARRATPGRSPTSSCSSASSRASRRTPATWSSFRSRRPRS